MFNAATNPAMVLAWALTPAFFTAGAALIAIPILIHLLNRRRFKIVQWAAMEYLLQALRKNRRRIKFEQLVLLATRCAILLLLGLALARPLGCDNSTLASLGQKAALHVFVIDNSYSMAYEADHPNGRTHLDQAKHLVKQQLDQLGGSESVAIIAAAGYAADAAAAGDVKPDELRSHIILRPSYDRDAAKAAVDRLEQSFAGTNIPGALQAALHVAAQEEKQPRKFLYILSDNTRSAWDNEKTRGVLKQLGPQIKTVFGRPQMNNLGKEKQWNHAVVSLGPEAGLVTSTFSNVFLTDVKGYGEGPETMLRWKWDEEQKGTTTKVRPTQDSGRQAMHDISTTEGGQHVLSVSIDTDGERLKLDNSRHRVVSVASALRVLIVEGASGSGALSGSGAYLDLSLAPKKEVGPDGQIRSETYVAPEVVSHIELGNKVLADYRALILTNVGSFTDGQADQIRKFVDEGGTLMLFMGDQVSSDNYNAALLPRQLLPGKLITRRTGKDGAYYHFDFKPSDPHRILDVFKGMEKSGLDTGRIFTYYQAELMPELKPDVVLSYVEDAKPTNDPAITVHNLGRGKVVYFSTTADGAWNSLQPKPAWIPLIHELLGNTVDMGDRWMNLMVGQSLQLPPTLKMTGSPTLLDSAKKQIAIDEVHQEGQVLYRSKPLLKPGMYQLSIGSNTGNKLYPIAVNVPDDEADIRALPGEALRKALGDIDIQMYGDTIPALSRNDSNDLGWTLMLIVLGLVAVECFMAMRFGHYRKPTVNKGPAA